MRYPITLAQTLLSLAVVIAPLCWWTYNFGGLFVIDSSPFQFTAKLLGTTLEISYLISAILEAYRVYLIIILGRNVYLALRGIAVRSYAILAASLSYLVYPLIIYYVTNYVIAIHHIPTSYPMVLMGSGLMSINYGGTNMIMTITITPHPIYWLALVVGLMVIPAYLEVKWRGRSISKGNV
ncbi:MAG: hypothetical protein ACP5GZ_09270 [Vulcanisaeta sp.]|uniref:hypothetical protein n=1 Tax=Vulcanisaeta sp. TaxID=2020871 RepID=UPI003D0F0923